MALRHVKEYYYKMNQQYIDLQNDLADFNQAFKDGLITIDKLDEVKNEMAQLHSNRDRLAYILFLFELPNREKKVKNKLKQDKKLVKYFKEKQADLKAVTEENESILTSIRQEIEHLIEGK